MSWLSHDGLDGAPTVTATSRQSDSAPARGLPPVVILLLGLLTTAVCLLLLFGPLYTPNPSPGELTRHLLHRLLDGRGPFFVQDWLWNRFVLIVAVLLVLVLAVLPWRAARSQRRGGRRGGRRISVAFSAAGSTSPGAGGVRVTRTVDRSSLTFSDDGRVLDEEHPGAATIERSVPELRAMAAAVGIPWDRDFETEGGARGVLEVIRAVSTGPVGVRRETASTPTDADLGAGLTQPVEQQDPAHDPDPLEEDSSDGYRYSAPSWSPSYSGSVYTSTKLYSSDRLEGPGEDEEQDR